MRNTLVSATLVLAASAAALPASQGLNVVVTDVASNVASKLTTTVIGIFNETCEALPLSAFNNTMYSHKLITLEEAKKKLANYKITSPIQKDCESEKPKVEKRATCAKLRVRKEWDNMTDAEKQAYVDAVKCLMQTPPSGQWPNSHSRYEDLVALHQKVTPNVHDCAKFSLWHRVFLCLFERYLEQFCHYDGAVPWFNEGRYAGHFAQSSFFSSKWFGSIAIQGRCVTDGQFANLNLFVGPQDSNTKHCLSRNGDGSATQHCGQGYLDTCRTYPDYAGFNDCSEKGPHGWGHNGIGGVMADVQASPGDPAFWAHHGACDRNYRLWLQKYPEWLTQINGNDHSGNPLTLDTVINTYGMFPNVKIRDILDTTGPTLCYKYDY